MYRHPDDNSYRDHSHFTSASYPRAPPSTSAFSYSSDRRSTSSSDLPATTSLLPAYHYNETVTEDPTTLDRPGGNPDTFSGSPHHTYAPEPRSAMTGPSSEHSVDSDSWQDGVQDTPQQEAPKPKKSRREKPRIELAPDQPPTTQGKPRARVYVACQQCRTRKIRCDGAKPVCHNCSRRANGGSDCNYDPVPKRRGPDKTPGARQRMARDLRNAIEDGPRRRRRTRDTSEVHQTNHQQSPVEQADVMQNDRYLTHNLPGSVPLDFSPLVDTAVRVPDDGAPNPQHLRSSYSQGASVNDHDDFRSSGTIGISTLKPISTITDYHTDYDLVDLIPIYGGNQHSYIAELDENGGEKQNNAVEISSGPSLNFSRKIWWDSLLCLYLSPNSNRLQRLTASQRESASHSITSDLRFLFRSSNYWFSFFHIPTFFSNYFDPPKREKVQPSLILALLAMSTFWQSSEIGYGAEGRERALRFRDEAQAAMDASFNAGWIDETLAQAAWLLALFEVCAHPYHSSARSTSSMVMLDSIIRSLSLTLVDAGDPDTTMFSPGTVPAVSNPKLQAIWLPSSPISPTSTEDTYKGSHNHAEEETGCSCRKFTLEGNWPSSSDHAPLWSSTPAWDESWTAAEVRKESCRRLCWSSMILAAGHISYTTAQRSQGLDLFISDPANYALLFSGESVARSPILSRHSSKDTIWALHDRSFLLWHGCIRMRNHSAATDTDKSQFAVRAWLEADSLEQALNKHTCSIERAFIFQAREYIFNTRMCISYEFQRFIPLVTSNVNGLFHRNKAEEWLTHQSIVAERFMYGLHTITGNASNLLARRPFFVFWFMGQIHRALALYECDSTLLVALDVCKALIPAIDYLTVLWPCAEQRHRYKSLRSKVVNACYVAGIDPPAVFKNSLSVPGSPQGLI